LIGGAHERHEETAGEGGLPSSAAAVFWKSHADEDGVVAAVVYEIEEGGMARALAQKLRRRRTRRMALRFSYLPFRQTSNEDELMNSSIITP
jgi:hypothetical protein